MKFFTTVKVSFSLLATSVRLCFFRPYLFLYLFVPIALPIILIFFADYYRMFDLVLYYRPVMKLVVYVLAGVQVFFTIYLSRRVVYLVDKTVVPRSDRFMLLVNALIWAAMIVAGMFLYSYVTQLLQWYVKNPLITNYKEPLAIILSKCIPACVFLLSLAWNCFFFVPPILAVEPVSLLTALRDSCTFVYRHIMLFIVISLFFFWFDLLPVYVPAIIPRFYVLTKQILPYCIQLVFATLQAVTYAVFYAKYRPLQSK